MKKLWRILLISGGVFFSLLILIVLAATVFLPADQIRHRVEAELVKATGAEVTIEDAGISWWPQLGVTLKDITIQGKGSDLARITGSANEVGHYAATLQRFMVMVEVQPLLKKEVVVDAVRILGLDLEMDLKGEPLKVTGADLAVKDLKISMDAAQEAGKPPAGAGKRPVGELIPEELVLAFEGSSHGLTVRKMPLVDVKFHGDLDARILTLENISASLGTGLLEGNLEIDYERNPHGFLDFEAQATAVPAKALLQPWAPALGEKLETDLGGTVRGSCLLGEQEVVHRTLSLHGEMSSAEGILWAREWLGEIAPYLGQRQDLMDIHFNSLSHSLRIDKGRYMVDELFIVGAETHWQSQGSLGLDGTIDLGVNVKLPKGFTPDLGKWSFLADTLRDADGRINLDLSLSGMAAKPQVGINLGSLQDAAKSDAGEAVKKGLGGLLDKWKNR